MGSYYSLTDMTADRELVGGNGRGIKQLMWFMENPSTLGDPVRIFMEWEYFGYDDMIPEPVNFTAEMLAQDAITIIDALSKVEDDPRFGAFHASEWIKIFKDVKSWTADHPTHTFRSQFFE